MLRILYHLVVTLHYAGVLYYDQAFIPILNKMPNDIALLKGRSKYLTMWNMLLQAIFFTVCTLNDLIGSNDNFVKKRPLIRALKDNLLACLAFPLSMFVGTTFWALYAVDRELVFPRALDAFFPSWLNHVMHTNIMLFILIEMATSYRKYPSRKVGLSILIWFLLTYLIWIHIIYSYTGMWVYPVLQVLNMPMRLVFFISLLGLSMGLYIVGEKLNSLLWSSQFQKLEVNGRKAH